MRASPDAFKPEAGAWGRQGCTAVRLDAVDEETVGEALTLAWRNSTAKPAVSGTKAKPAGGARLELDARCEGEQWRFPALESRFQGSVRRSL